MSFQEELGIVRLLLEPMSRICAVFLAQEEVNILLIMPWLHVLSVMSNVGSP